MATQTLPITVIRIDGGTQPRSAISEDTVREYAEAMTENAVFPPVALFYDGAEYWLADGFHRYHAARKIQLLSLPCEVHHGTRRDAVLFSVGVNQAHGLRRTNADKRKAVLTLLNDEEWCGWSNSEIARRCHVGHPLVGEVRRSLEELQVTPASPTPSASRTYKTKHGTEAQMHTENIGRRRSELTADEIEGRKAAAMVPTSHALRRLPAVKTAAAVEGLVGSLRGTIGALAAVNASELADDPRAGEWRAVLSDAIGLLRRLHRELGTRRETEEVA